MLLFTHMNNLTHFCILKEMRKLARLWSPDLRQIDLDVNRTYRDHLMFRERYGLKQQALFHILGAYSVYNAEIGMFRID